MRVETSRVWIFSKKSSQSLGLTLQASLSVCSFIIWVFFFSVSLRDVNSKRHCPPSTSHRVLPLCDSSNKTTHILTIFLLLTYSIKSTSPLEHPVLFWPSRQKRLLDCFYWYQCGLIASPPVLWHWSAVGTRHISSFFLPRHSSAVPLGTLGVIR